MIDQAKEQNRKLLFNQSLIRDPAKNPWQFHLLKTVNGLNPFINVGKTSILDAWLGSEYAPFENSLSNAFYRHSYN